MDTAQVTPGARLGPYEVLARIGSGGMGEVYRAVDTRLQRTVAIKVLHTQSPNAVDERIRFEREVRAISNTNHPHICALYDVGEDHGVEFLVMEYLQGQTLAQRLLKGRLPIEQVLLYGCQIASALGHVHRHGFVHRDVKPSNVMLTETGAKLLDFGIAKPAEQLPFDAGASTLHTLTLSGALVGTVQYMAPEQLEGLETDSRTDTFALGLVLYEMASGRKAFAGSSTAGTIAAILSSEPPPLEIPKFKVQRVFEHAVRKCLAKSPDDRWQNIMDLGSELEWIRATLAEEEVDSSSERELAATALRRRLTPAWAITGLVILAGGSWFARDAWRSPRPIESPVVRFLSYPPRGNQEIYFGLKSALSPDGRYLVSATRLPDGRRPLWLRPLDSTTGVELEGSDPANYPFWSPDSRFIGYFGMDGQLKRIELPGGRPQNIGQDPSAGARGATWNSTGTIVVGSDGTSLFRLSASGSPVIPLTVVDSAAGELGHTLPQFLPDGDHFIFLVRSTDASRAGIYVSSLSAPSERRRILDLSGEAQYVQNHLIFSKNRALFAQPFDLQTFTLRSAPLISTAYYPAGGRTGFSVSQSGVLAYQAASPRLLTWFDRVGKRLGPVTTGDTDDPVMSLDESRIAVAKLDPQSGKRRIWISGPSLSSLRRGDFAGAAGTWNEVAPVWSPQGDRLLFASDREGHFELYSRAVDGSDEQVIFRSNGDKWPLDWSPDGRYVLFRGGGSPGDLWALPLEGDRQPMLLSQNGPVLAAAKISRDGQWLAYVSSEVGGGEVFVRPFPSGEPKVQISFGGGGEPRWRADGRELFYLTADGLLMAVPVRTSPRFEAGAPVALFRTNVTSTVFIGAPARNQYDSAANGQRFLISEPPELISSTPMTIVLNWQTALRRK
jgi:eukaryotic-like serine/threonine-protein kinase